MRGLGRIRCGQLGRYDQQVHCLDERLHSCVDGERGGCLEPTKQHAGRLSHSMSLA